MYIFNKRRAAQALAVTAMTFILFACGGSDDPPLPPPPPAPPPAPPPQAIRGVLNNELVSGNLPSASIPSGALPSASLPANSLPAASLPAMGLLAGSLPTVEIDETPSILTVRNIVVTMQASQEVGTEVVEGETILSALGTLKVDEITGNINAKVTAANVAFDDEVTAVHIHSGFAGENGPVLIGLEQISDNPVVFSVNSNISNLADELGNDLETFLDGGWYFNLHTTSNPAGHVRGQIFTDEIDVARTQLQGKQENPAVVNAEGISGVAYVTLNPDEGEIVANVSVQGFVPFLDVPIGPVHLHSAFAGVNGPVFLPLFPVGDSDTVFRGTEADAIAAIDFANIALGGAYVNVHSAENPGGEVRGQVVPKGVDVSRTELQGAQENPAIVNAPGINGVAYVTFSEAQNSVVGAVTVEGFTPFLDAPIGPVHIHSSFAGRNGGVIIPLAVVPGTDELQYFGNESAAIAAIDFDLLAAGGYYVNVHSAANPSGEVRGQIVPSNVDVARTKLQGAQQNPAVQNLPGISGVAYVTVNSIDETVVGNVTVAGFTPFLDAPIGPVHLHANFAGQNGPVIIPLPVVPDSNDLEYSGTQADAIADIDFDMLAEGGYYVNVHSAANPGGEVRGQVVPRNVEVLRSKLQGAQENQPVVNAVGISGVGYVTLNAKAGDIQGNVTVEGFIPFLDAAIGPVHLHTGFAGQNGPVFLPLFPVDGSETVFQGDESDAIAEIDFAAIAKGQTYINVHSAENPGGEVRGQLVPRNVDVTRAELQGQQENPVVINAEGISGVGYVTLNPKAETIVSLVSVQGFTPFLDAPVGPVHLHTGFAGQNGPVFLPLSPVGDSDTDFMGTQDDAIDDIDFDTIAIGGTYINVHSEANAGGEVRGQVAPKGVDIARAKLQGQQENPAVVNAEGIGGVGYVTVNASANSVVGAVTVEGFTPFLDVPIGPVHLHANFAGRNGPVVLPLAVVEGTDDLQYFGTQNDAIADIDFDMIAKGGYYINVHSQANPGGEVRGQVVLGDVNVSRAKLQGQQENPAVVNADGIAGVGYVTFSKIQNSVVGAVSVQGFTPFLDAPIGPVHLHANFAGANGPVILPLAVVAGTNDLEYFGTQAAAIDTIDFGMLATGGYYINVHSEANPGGELRGQVLSGNTQVVRSEMKTEQEVPAVTTPAADNVSGIGYITFDAKDIAVSPVVNVTVSGFEATMVHVHRGGVAGVTGPVQIGLEDISPSEAPGTVWTSNDGQVFSLGGLSNGAYYFNAHSEVNPAGEVRGQILVDNISAFRADLDGASVLPNANASSATGVGFITLNKSTETFNTNVQVFNFDPLPSQVTLNIGGDQNNVLTELSAGENGFFSATGDVANLQGLLTGAYSLQANE